jgi:hypothetical protein
MKLTLAIVAGALGLAAAAPVLAHHSFAAEFDSRKPVRLEGTLSKIEWTNPHSYFYVQVRRSDGAMVEWGCEGANPGQLTRRGIKRGDLKLGDKLVVDGFLARSGAQTVTVPYRANRAVIFDSNLFHKTDTIRFAPGYENRRVNITMLYGRRGRS